MAKTIEIQGFVHLRPSALGPGSETYSFMSTDDMTQYGYALIGPHTISYEVPEDFEPVKAQVNALEKEREAVRAEYTRRVAQINDQISKLTAIEYKPAEVAA